MVSENGLDTPLGDQLAAESRGVEELSVGIALSLHPPILDDPAADREHRWAIESTVS